METKKIRKVIPMLDATPEHVIKYGSIDYRASALNIGRYNGYIAIPMEMWERMRTELDPESYYSCEYDRVPTSIDEPHGGWTYGAQEEDFSIDDRWIPLLDIRKVNTINYMIIGFDTCHFNDNYKIWTAKTVREEVFRVYESVQDYIKRNFNNK